MIEQTDVTAGTGPDAPVVSLRLALADEARASMEAVRAAQEAARVRARRQTAQARRWFAGSVIATVLVGFVAGPPVARWRHARAQAAVPAPAHASAPKLTAAAPEPPVVSATQAPVVAAPPVAAAPVAAQPLPAAALPAPAVTPPDGVEPDRACDTALVRGAPWRLSPDACARAFAAAPNDAALALAVAQAEHAHAHLGKAAEWAHRALTLDPNAAEAYVIIGRAAAAAGRADDARAAYGRYLELAPRGWHRAEARAAARGAPTAR